MKYHNVHSISVKDCQQMIVSKDYMMIRRCKSINILSKVNAKKAYEKFIEDLQELFSGEEINKLIDIDVIIQRLSLRQNKLSMLYTGLECCYMLKDSPTKIKILDKLKKHYRELYSDYPKTVDAEAEADEQKKQTEAVLKPIEDEIKRLGYKIKEISPRQEIKKQKEQKQVGLELHIQFIESVHPEKGYLDRTMSVFSLKQAYDQAVNKNIKLKANV